ncbi:MAG: 2-oxoglutarate-acceptor oxidoreductase subunit OorD [candidate division TA06 bacterium ADurb.Bin417]|uniref:2-oxoglutarate-acceptor oxidoreductase subunit OorD n=1 Tax=candidate division TA06 bacterium ADurb.Bin417 TaxID=1852828 RepID=A0A1V5MKK2_UNCT6|nr:MAG: 2-oxoglutarate-acceptor oxidoreductase subunit OorD [candidate division TA06 bacterium ADurb.Bin417]
MGKTGFEVKVDIERCKGCGLCLAFCTRGHLSLSETKNRRGCHYALVRAGGQSCTGCLRCALICPDAALEITRSEGPVLAVKSDK